MSRNVARPINLPSVKSIDEVIDRLRVTGFDDEAELVRLLKEEARFYYRNEMSRRTESTGPE